MKRTFFFVVFFLFSLLSLFATSYISNELGQKKEETEDNKRGWVLVEDEKSETLYYNGEVVETKITTDSLITKIRGTREERIFLDGEGKIERRIINDGENEKEYNYIYREKILSGYNYSLNGVLIERIDYFTTDDGSLVYYSVNDDGVYISDNFFVRSSGEAVAITEYNNSENERVSLLGGGYSEKDGENTLYYDSFGRLRREESSSESIEYVYSNDGELIETRTSNDGGVIVTSYIDDKVTTRYDKEGNKISERRTLENGEIEDVRFSEGEAKYIFIYDRDGKRIKEVKAL